MYTSEQIEEFIMNWMPKIEFELRKWTTRMHNRTDVEDVRQEIYTAMVEFAVKQGKTGGDLFYPSATICHRLCEFMLRQKPLSMSKRTSDFNKKINKADYVISLEGIEREMSAMESDFDWDDVNEIIDFKTMISRLPEKDQIAVQHIHDGYPECTACEMAGVGRTHFRGQIKASCHVNRTGEVEKKRKRKAG